MKTREYNYQIVLRSTSALLFVASLLLFGCGNDLQETHVHEGEEHEESLEDKTEVELTPKQVAVMEIRTGKFREMDLASTVKSSGKMELPPQNKASLSAIMAGRVEEITVLQGEYVKKGQILARLANPEFLTIQEDYLRAVSELAYQEKEYQRKKTLFEDSIASAKSYQAAEAELIADKSRKNALAAKLRMMDINPESVESGNFFQSIPVRSPINGYVQLIEINMGKFVDPMQEMFEIVDNEHIHIDLMVYENDFNKVKVGQKVLFTLTSRPDSVIAGKIFAVGKSFEESPRAVLMHAEIDNKGGNLLPGMYVDARIVTEKSKVLALPEEAVISDAGLNYIFIKSGSGHSHGEGEHHVAFRKIEVMTGVRDLGHVEVKPVESLPKDADIVVTGAFYLIAEMKKGEGGHGHSH